MLRDRDAHPGGDVDRAFFWCEVARDHAEERALARAVLAHQGYLRPFADRKIRAGQNRLAAIVERDIIEADDDVGGGHIGLGGGAAG